MFERRAAVGDLAALLGCTSTYLWRLARQRGWERPPDGAGPGAAPAPEPSDELKGIEAALRDPALHRSDFVRLAERATVLLATEAMVSGDPRLDRRIAQLSRLVDLAGRFPAPVAAHAAPATEELDEERFNALCADLAVRFERWQERRKQAEAWA